MSGNFKSRNANTPTKGILQQVLDSTLNKLNLVTRHEFATQTQVLLKTRLRVEELERKIMELEGRKQPP